jgi:SAM-dependent methyltransferase
MFAINRVKVRRRGQPVLDPAIDPTALAHFEERRRHAHQKIATTVPVELRTGRFLDIGCGLGNGVVAALQHGARLAVGIDRSFEEFGHILAPSEAVCSRYGVDAQKALVIEGDVFQMRFHEGSFDYALMLDSVEHVPDPGAFFQWARSAIRPGGYFVVDTCPLYYSRMGHHLWPCFPPETVPWLHLRDDFEELLDKRRIDTWHLERFRELNRATHDDIRAALLRSGFDLVSEHRSTETSETRTLLERLRPRLRLDGIPEPLLFEDWILLVGQRAH